MNPLLAVPFEIQFDAIGAAHVEPAIGELIAASQSRIEAIVSQTGPRTFANTMMALDAATEPLDVALNIVRHLESVATTPELRAAYNAVQAEAALFYSGIPLNAGLWKALKDFAATPEAKALTGVEARALEKTIDSFRRHGADLDDAGKKRLEDLNVELSTITTRFAENVLDSTNVFEYYITEKSGLAGLPPSAIAAARQSAESKGREGWRFTLQQPSYLAVLTYLDDRALRAMIYRAYATRATQGDFDNAPVLHRILALRREMASLLGYANFADLVLTERMAKTGSAALRFLEDLLEKTKPYFARENEALNVFVRTTDSDAVLPLEPWDISYYAEKERVALFDFDEEELRPYFPLPKVMEGMFEIAGRLFGIRVVERAGPPVWHADVRFFDILDVSGEHIGSFYSDFYPREDKRGGAWMDAFHTGMPEGAGWTPHLGLICGNLTPPIGDDPALLTHRDVETVFHEFGHLLHHSLSRVPVRGLAGTNVAWDFVELPSQIMENWCWEREALDLFARHHKTGEPIPEDLFQKVVRARNFRGANAQMRQLSFSIVDLKLHTQYSPERDGDVIAYSRSLLSQFAAAPLPPEHAMIASFTHLFSSGVGYAAGYYSYKWAEVLEADAFSRFRAEGVFNSEVGRDFRDRILSRGNSQDPAILYREFMGRDPDPSALLIRTGLV